MSQSSATSASASGVPSTASWSRQSSSARGPTELQTGVVEPPSAGAFAPLTSLVRQTQSKLEAGGSVNLREDVLKPIYHCVATAASANVLLRPNAVSALEAAISIHDAAFGANAFLTRCLPTMAAAAVEYFQRFGNNPLSITPPISEAMQRHPQQVRVEAPLEAEGEGQQQSSAAAVTTPVVVQETGGVKSISQEFTKGDCLCLLSCAFLCLFPRVSANCVDDVQELPSINYDEQLFARVSSGQNSVEVAKTLMVLDYFEEMTDRKDPEHPLHNTFDAEKSCSIRFERREVMPAIPSDAFQSKLLPMKMHPLKESIDDQKDMIRADFANMVIGGGAIAYGCVQEEIMFSICPELVVSRLLYPPMKANEAIVMYGAEQFSTVKPGTYAFSLQHGGPLVNGESLPNGSVITAIDALDFRYGGRSKQYSPAAANREVTKAYVGFNVHSRSGGEGDSSSSNVNLSTIPRKVATGNWGCGAFLGDPSWKLLLQWIACSMAGKEMHYFPFTEESLLSFQSLSDALVEKGILCADLYEVMTSEEGKLIPAAEASCFDLIRSHYELGSPTTANTKAAKPNRKRGG